MPRHKVEQNVHITPVRLAEKLEKLAVRAVAVSRFHIGFSEILPLFKGFIEINRGLAVNMLCIDMIKSSVITMCDGKSYKIARGKKDDVVARYTAFVLKQK